ncbi:GDP-mannose transporter [Zancudomyces culisetae]|uniref:GDP-mannose transporter n=1 Tax=Zancudomyces culisetae TaxID=1213189 RepID=A0A1R1PGG6_ZANCU|nr:GDP-mannose transporter [Zancudomyces culisetae]|eukprot:OMH80085.1 GDP-mannose transporter [Zancudomyces culisetae]
MLLLVIAGKLSSDIKYRALNKKDVQKWMPVALSQSMMLYTGAKALQYLNVPLFTVFKNLTIIAVAYGERFVFKTPVTRLMLSSFFLMVLSSIVGALNDIKFNLQGYTWVIMNCVCTAFYVVVMRKVILTVNFKDFDTVYYNNFLTLGIFVLLSLFTEPWTKFYDFYKHNENSAELMSYISANSVSAISAFAISYTSAWCIRTTSSTTYSMTGALNKLPIAVFSMLWFPDPVSFGAVLAVILGFSAGILYTHAKNVAKRETPVGKQSLPPPATLNTSTSDYGDKDVLASPNRKD